jgi:hypothetical protein
MNSDTYYKAVTRHGYVMGSYTDEQGNFQMEWAEPQWGNCYDTEQECVDTLLDWQQESVVPVNGVRRRPTLAEMETDGVQIVKAAR